MTNERPLYIAPLRAVTRKRDVKYDVNTVNSSPDELAHHVGTPCGRGKLMPGSDISSLHIVLHTTLSCNGA